MREGHRQRLKQRFLSNGIGAFSDYEVLEFLLFFAIPQGDTKPVAHRLLDKFKTVKSVFNADIKELEEVDGIGSHAATLIKFIPQLSAYYTGINAREKEVIHNSCEAGNFVCAHIGALPNEVFAVLCLDASRGIIAFEILEEGTVSQANVHPRKVVECAFRHNASEVILAHNHPSGNSAASENDRQITKVLCSVMEELGIHVTDHIITTSGKSYISMADHGLMPN